jgi:uncharacterized membrane protein
MKIILILLTCLYPIVIFYSLSEFPARWVSLFLLFFFLARMILNKKNQSTSSHSPIFIHPHAYKILSSGIILMFVLSFLWDTSIGLLFYPAMINSLLAIVFLYSLFYPPSMIERIARLSQPLLPSYAVIYTRKVTYVWLVFFILNTFIASYTALFSNLQVWTLYNGLIAYALMGLLFVIEYGIRLKIKKDHNDEC